MGFSKRGTSEVRKARSVPDVGRRAFSLLMAIVLAVGLMPLPAFAEFESAEVFPMTTGDSGYSIVIVNGDETMTIGDADIDGSDEYELPKAFSLTPPVEGLDIAGFVPIMDASYRSKLNANHPHEALDNGNTDFIPGGFFYFEDLDPDFFASDGTTLVLCPVWRQQVTFYEKDAKRPSNKKFKNRYQCLGGSYETADVSKTLKPTLYSGADSRDRGNPYAAPELPQITNWNFSQWVKAEDAVKAASGDASVYLNDLHITGNNDTDGSIWTETEYWPVWKSTNLALWLGANETGTAHAQSTVGNLNLTRVYDQTVVSSSTYGTYPEPDLSNAAALTPDPQPNDKVSDGKACNYPGSTWTFIGYTVQPDAFHTKIANNVARGQAPASRYEDVFDSKGFEPKGTVGAAFADVTLDDLSNATTASMIHAVYTRNITVKSTDYTATPKTESSTSVTQVFISGHIIETFLSSIPGIMIADPTSEYEWKMKEGESWSTVSGPQPGASYATPYSGTYFGVSYDDLTDETTTINLAKVVQGTEPPADETVAIDSVTAADATYTGTDVAPTLTVKDANNNTVPASATDGYTYEVFTDSGCTTKAGDGTKATGVGTFYVKVTGHGNYTGEKIAEFKVTAGTVTVTFLANGGTGTMASQDVTYDTATTLNTNSFTAPAGKVFEKWTVTSGTADKSEYSDGDSIKTTGAVTLTAQWKDAPASAIDLSNYTITTKNSTYSATAKTASDVVEKVALTSDGTQVLAESNYQLKFYSDAACSTEATPTNAGTYYVKALPPAGSSTVINQTAAASFKIDPADLSDPDVKAKLSLGSIADKEYCGAAIEPTPTVSFNGVELAATTGYKYTYSDNTNKGTAKIKIESGTDGNFTNSATLDAFEITAYNLNNHSSFVTVADVADQAYTGSQIKPEPAVTIGDETDYSALKDYALVKDTDFTYSYGANTNAGTAAGSITITGTGNFTGTLNATFNITPKAIAAATVSGAVTYTGADIPLDGKLTVTLDGTNLTADDFEIETPADGKIPATETGSYSVTVKGKGNYSGTATGTVTINPGDLSTADVTLTPSTLTYDGTEKHPTSVKVVLDGVELTEDTHYTVTWPTASIDEGDYTATIVGIGGFAGSQTTATYTIASNVDVTIDANGGQWNGQASTTLQLPVGQGYYLTAPQRQYYDFVGWQVVQDGGGKLTGNTFTPGASPATLKAIWKLQTKTMYRLYNPNSGEHFYTESAHERDEVARAGWNYEGIGWVAPVRSNTPVYRLYSGTDHHYTMSAQERDQLIQVGWKYEGIGWYSDDEKSVPLYRQFNPNVEPSAPTNNSGSHNYTVSKEENDILVNVGWIAEGIGWYAVRAK